MSEQRSLAAECTLCVFYLLHAPSQKWYYMLSYYTNYTSFLHMLDYYVSITSLGCQT